MPGVVNKAEKSRTKGHASTWGETVPGPWLAQ